MVEYLFRGHSKSTFVEEGRGGRVTEKQTKMNRGGGPWHVCTFAFKKNAEIFKMKFYTYSPVFLLIIMAV